jgi:autotransporter-associated beta strand protein
MKTNIKTQSFIHTTTKQICFVLMLFATSSLLFAQSGSWSSLVNGSWDTAANWISSIIADGVDNTASFTTGTPVTVTLNSNRTIGNINIQNGFSINSASTEILTLQVTSGSPTITATLMGPGAVINSRIAGTQGFTKAGGATLYLTNSSNSFTGDVLINAGQLRTDNPGTLNGQNVYMQGGLWRNSSIGGTYTNNIILNSASNLFTHESVTAVDLTGVISELGGPRNLSLARGPVISSAIIQLSGNNTYTGDTIIGATSPGGSTRVTLANNNALGAGTSNVTFAANGHTDDGLRLTGGITISNKTLTLKGPGLGGVGSLTNLSGNNAWNGNINLGTDANPTIGAANDSLTVSGVISGSATGGLNISGSGTVILTAANTYTTGTTVNSGTLLVNNTTGSGTGTGNVSVNSTGTLGGTGTIAGNVTINSGGTLSPGNASHGTLTLGSSNLTFNAGSSGVMEINSPAMSGLFDRVVGINNFVLGGDLTINISPTFSVAQTYNLFNFASKSGSFNSITIAGSYSGSMTLSGEIWTLAVSPSEYFEFNQLTGNLVFIPEPGHPAVLALVAGLAFVCLRRMRIHRPAQKA